MCSALELIAVAVFDHMELVELMTLPMIVHGYSHVRSHWIVHMCPSQLALVYLSYCDACGDIAV